MFVVTVQTLFLFEQPFVIEFSNYFKVYFDLLEQR